MRRSAKKGKPNKGKIQNATRVLSVNGLQFRSKLELFTYNKLVESGITDFKYEEEKFILQEALEYPFESIEAYERTIDGNKVKKFEDVDHKIRYMSYLPDFTNINHETKEGWILEVKGFANDAWPLKWKLFKHYLIGNGYKVSLYKPNNQGNAIKCIEMIKDKYYGDKQK